jgi:Lrp/AsnC family transcriptional regulator for asnA, asnC and gidA
MTRRLQLANRGARSAAAAAEAAAAEAGAAEADPSGTHPGGAEPGGAEPGTEPGPEPGTEPGRTDPEGPVGAQLGPGHPDGHRHPGGRRSDSDNRHRLAPVVGTGPSGLLDDANRAIIEALQRDGRLAYGTIAEEVGLSEAAVRRRVQRLRDAGVMQIVAVTDPLQLGFHRQAMVGVRVEGDVRQVADRLTALDEVDYVVMCAGSFDLLVEVVCEDDDALFHLLNDSFRSIPGVRGTESFVYLKLAKQTYSWGTR